MRNFIVIIIVACVFQFSCSKERKLQKGCMDFPKSQSDLGYEYIDLYPLVRGASFNPNNSNEIVYLKYDGLFDRYLMTYNLVTDVSQVLHQDVFNFQPKWSMKDWIVFNNTHGQLWKIKSNGDSLTQLSINIQAWYPEWSPDGGNLIFLYRDQGIGNLRIIDINGNIVEDWGALSTFWPQWSPDNTKIAFPFDKSLGWVNLNSPTETHRLRLFEDDSDDSMGNYSLDWFPDSQRLLWVNRANSLFVTNIESDCTTKIKHGCDSKFYIAPSISNDGTKILVTRFDSFQEENTISTEGNIYIMDADGNNERQLNLF